jgi:hypothetical protein
MRALIIKPGADLPEELTLPDEERANYEAIRDAIGGWVSSCFSVPGSEGGCIYGYCDDEFLLTGRKDWSVCLGDTFRTDAPYPIGGPVVITGVTSGGETRGLTEKEASSIRMMDVKVRPNALIFGRSIPALPLLQWERYK